MPSQETCARPGLIEALLANQRIRPFGRRVVVVPHVEDEGLLRLEVTRAAGREGAPLVGTIFRTPEQLGAVLRPGDSRPALSAQALRLQLLSDLQTTEKNLCGRRMPQAWRVQAPLALALAEDGLAALPIELIAETFADDPAFASLVRWVHQWLGELDGPAPWDLAGQVDGAGETWLGAAGRLEGRGTTVDGLLGRLGLLDTGPAPVLRVDRVANLGNGPASARWVAEQIAVMPGTTTAVVLLEPGLEAILQRALTDCRVPFTASPRPASFPLLLSEFQRLHFSDDAPLPISRLWRELPLTAAALPALAERWVAYADLRLTPAAFASEVQRDMRRHLAPPAQPATVHLFSAQRLPVLNYDRVFFIGAEQGNPNGGAAVGGALLSPRRAALLAQAGLAGFRSERSRQQLGLDRLACWASAGEEVIAVRRTVDEHGRALPLAAWLPRRAGDAALSPAPAHRHPRAPVGVPHPQRHRLPLPRDWNPTRLRRLLQCPQQSLLCDVLGLRGAQDAVIDQLGSGSLWGVLVHRVIERACRCEPTDPLAVLEREAAAVASKEGAELPRPVREDLAHELVAAARPLLTVLGETGISIEAVEHGMKGAIGDRQLSARCDLMVRDAEDRQFAIDVKTGAPKSPDNLALEVRTGRELQRAFYRHLAPQIEDAYLMYSRAPAHLRPTGAELESVSAGLQTFVDLGDALWREGAFAPAPDRDRACGYCPVRAACRADSPEWCASFDALAGSAEAERAQTSGRKRK